MGTKWGFQTATAKNTILVECEVQQLCMYVCEREKELGQERDRLAFLWRAMTHKPKDPRQASRRNAWANHRLPPNSY